MTPVKSKVLRVLHRLARPLLARPIVTFALTLLLPCSYLLLPCLYLVCIGRASYELQKVADLSISTTYATFLLTRKCSLTSTRSQFFTTATHCMWHEEVETCLYSPCLYLLTFTSLPLLPYLYFLTFTSLPLLPCLYHLTSCKDDEQQDHYAAWKRGEMELDHQTSLPRADLAAIPLSKGTVAS
jgi:hypothetical protein